MKTYKFVKQDNNWYIDLPEYLEQGGSMGDLQMVDGADKMLDLMAGNNNSVNVSISEEPFDDADKVVLIEKCDPYIGGGYYFMKTYEEQAIDRTMWLCQVTEFVFGKLPEQIFVRREKNN